VLSLKDRIELLEADLKGEPPSFIMSRDLPFAIFRYDPNSGSEREWESRRQIQQLKVRVENATRHKIQIISLADLFWRSIRESEGVEAIVELEKEHGFEAAQRQVNQYLSDADFRPLRALLLETVERLPKEITLLFFVHGTAFAPSSYRISSLLEQLGGTLRLPAVMFYPGTWNRTLNYMGLRSEDQALGSYRVKIYGRES
jgi:BREX protein BrxB